MCSIELGDMKQGFKSSELAVRRAGKADASLPLYSYLAALCSKAVENLNTCKHYYDSFRLGTTGVRPNEIKSFVFGVMLSGVVGKREVVENCVERYEKLCAKLRAQFREGRVDRTGLAKYCNNDGQWMSLKTSKILTILKKLPFFCRFAETQLIKVISFSSYRTLPGDHLLLVSQSEAAVVLAGKATLYTYVKGLMNHEVITQCGIVLEQR